MKIFLIALYCFQDVENWTWEEPVKVLSEPNSVQHKIEMYRQQAYRAQPEKVEEHDPDFFEVKSI